MNIYKCEHCNYETDRSNNIKRHMESPKHKIKVGEMEKVKVEKEKVYYKCDQCEYKSDRRPNLERHILSEHTNKKIKCEYCETTHKQTEYVEHIKTDNHYSNVMIEYITYSARCKAMIKNKLSSIEILSDNKPSTEEILKRFNIDELSKYNTSKSLLNKHNKEYLNIIHALDGKDIKPEIKVTIKEPRNKEKEQQQPKIKENGESTYEKLKNEYTTKLNKLKELNIDYSIDEDYYNDLLNDSYLKIDDFRDEMTDIIKRIDLAIENNN